MLESLTFRIGRVLAHYGVMEHVRAGMEVVRAEIEAAGFRHTRTIEILKENFVLEFELPAT